MAEFSVDLSVVTSATDFANPDVSDEGGNQNANGSIDATTDLPDAEAADNMPSTGRDDMLYPYVVMITPTYKNLNDIVVKVGAFEDQVLPTSNKYTPVTREADYMEGKTKLTIKVGKEVLADMDAGIRVGRLEGLKPIIKFTSLL